MINILLNQGIKGMTESPKAALLVAGGATSTGLGSWLDMLPTILGLSATAAGFILSILLMYTHWQRHKRERAHEQRELELHKVQLGQIQKRRID